MSVTLTGTGGLFTRLGKIFGGIKHVNTFLGSSDISAGGLKSVGVFFDAIDAQFASTRQDLVTGLYTLRDALRQRANSDKSALSSLASTVVIEQVNDDTTLTSKTLPLALKELIRQMVSSSDKVKANTTSVSVTAGTNNGTSNLLATVKGPNGANREYLQNESIVVTCTSDAQGGAATEDKESWSVQGVPATSDDLQWDWPKGSAVATTLTSVAPGGALNILENGDFETFTTANTPDDWTIDAGVVATQIFSSTTAYKGSKSLKFTGSGGVNTTLRQKFDTSGNNTYILKTSTVYAFSAYVQVPSAVPAAGVLRFALVNSSGTVLTDDQSAALSVSTTLSGLGAADTWYNVSGFFCTPAVLSSSTPLGLQIKLTTAITNGNSVLIDNVTLTEATEAYAGGPYLALIPGNVRAVALDKHTAAVANNWAGAFQSYIQRTFNIRSMGLQIPSDSVGGETISDSLVS